MKIQLSAFLLFAFVFSFAQEIYDAYPQGQSFYKGGLDGLYTDIRKIIKENEMKPCDNNFESYEAAVLVNPDSKINFVKDFDTLKISKNKCAYDFSKALLPHLKNWIPAKIDDIPVKAIATFKIDPFYLYYSNISPKKNMETSPEFPKGLSNFQGIVGDIFSRLIKDNKNTYAVMTFVVGTTGKMEDIVITGDYNEKEKKSLIDELSRMREKWKPATFNGQPVKSRMRMPIRQNFDFEWERKKQEEQEKKFNRPFG